METETLNKTRKRLFAYLCIILTVSVNLTFSIVDYIEGDKLEMLLDILICLIFIAGFIGIKKFNADMLVYRLVLFTLSIGLLYSILIGSGNGTVVYWLFPFPIVFMFFLGKNEGLVFSIFFLIILSVLLINPFSFEIYFYDIDVAIRFIASLIFLTLISFGIQASLERYARILIDKHNNLMEEKDNIEKALKQIKTLRGLIPICSNCKKIRDDKGYWQQVEVYVRDHSNADFTHGICPECFKKLYPGYDYQKE